MTQKAAMNCQMAIHCSFNRYRKNKRDAVCYFCLSILRMTLRWILPLMVLGSSGTNSMRGYVVRGGHPLDVVLQLFFELLARLIAAGEDDGHPDHLAAHRVGGGGDGAFEDARILQKGAFHLKGSDAVTRALDDVVVAADEPIVAVGVLPGHYISPVIARRRPCQQRAW